MVLGKLVEPVRWADGEDDFDTGSMTTNEALRLLVLTQFFPPDFAATGQLIEELVTELGRQGLDVSVFTGAARVCV